jgi:exonuclease III
LETNKVDIMSITELELPPGAPMFSISGYITFGPANALQKIRALVLVRAELATRSNARIREDLMSDTVSAVYVQLDAHETRAGGRIVQHAGVLFGGVYRTWTDSAGDRGLKVERELLLTLIDQVERAAAASRSVIIMGDLNMDTSRREDSKYTRRKLLQEFTAATEAVGYEYMPTGETWTSYSEEDVERRSSVLDHCYVAGVGSGCCDCSPRCNN